MEFINMNQKKLECNQYTLVIGLVNLPERYLQENIKNMDLTLIKECLINHALNFNNYMKQVWLCYDRSLINENKPSFGQIFTNFFSGNNNLSSRNYQDKYPKTQLVTNTIENIKGTTETTSKITNPYKVLKKLNRNEFFLYSASLSFHPNIKCLSDLLDPKNRGGIVFTITAKMPVDERRRRLYQNFLLSYLGKNSIVLEVKSETNPSIDSIISNTNVVREDQPVESSTVLKPIPKYFDEDYSDEDSNETKCSDKHYPADTYSFFRHNTHLLSKYATSRLVMREDDEFVTQRLLQVKLQRNQKNSR